MSDLRARYGPWAVVTGASSGIGRETVLLLAAHGFQVFAGVRKASDGSALVRAARAALRSGGVLGIWSSSPDRNFSQRLGRAGFGVEEFRVRAHGSRGARHVIWIATRPGDGS